jgi:hypothetical protein
MAPLAAAVLVRIAGLTGILASTTAVVGELALGAVMAAASVAAMRQRRVVGACAAGALAAGAVLAPFQTLLFLSIAHNLTPLAFLADALEGSVRRRVLLLMSVLFLVMPLFIASGLPYALLSHAGLPDAEASVFSAGPLLANIGVYVPRSLLDTRWAVPMFSASVFAQCMHYAVVILVLPRLIGAGTAAGSVRTLAPWPDARRFAVFLAAAALALAAGFAIDFKIARQFYGLAALTHSWLEIPVLLLFFARGGGETLSQFEGVKRKAEAGRHCIG